MKNKNTSIKLVKRIKALKKRYSHVLDVQNTLCDRARREWLNDLGFNPTDHLDEEDGTLFNATVIELEQLDEEINTLLERASK